MRYLNILIIICIWGCISCSSPRLQEDMPTPQNMQPTKYKDYSLIWSDEFNIPGSPQSHWNYEFGFVRNRELQWYQKDNAEVIDGALVITARQEIVENNRYDSLSTDWRRNRPIAQYTSSCITTKNSFYFKYGRLEVRARIPATAGSWPAIWTLGNKWPWPSNGELDVMEFYYWQGEPCILANACWASVNNDDVWDDVHIPYSHFLNKDPNWASKFHIWRMDWDENTIVFSLDGEILNEVDLSDANNGGSPQHNINPFSNTIDDFGHYILLNLALDTRVKSLDPSIFPMKYEIDYVRVYKHE